MPGVLFDRIINVNLVGDNQIIAAFTGEFINVFQLFLVCEHDVTIKFKEAEPDIDLTKNIFLNRSIPFILPYTSVPWFQTTKSARFEINLDKAVQVSGRIYYSQNT